MMAIYTGISSKRDSHTHEAMITPLARIMYIYHGVASVIIK